MKSGFTLLELLIVTIIVGIVASFAVPAYITTKRRASANEAIANLHAMIGAEKARRLLQGGFIQCDCQDPGTGPNQCDYPGAWNVFPGCNAILHLKMNPQEWAYTASFFGGSFYGNTLQVQAVRKRPGCTYSIQMTGDVIRFGAYNESLTSAGGDCPF